MYIPCTNCMYVKTALMHYKLKGPIHTYCSLVMIWLPPLMHINTNTSTHTCRRQCLRYAKWKLCVRASSRTEQLPAMPATLSKPNGLSVQQHRIWRVVHFWAFCGISGTFSLSGFACHSVREPAVPGWWSSFEYASRKTWLFLPRQVWVCIHRWKHCLSLTQPKRHGELHSYFKR